MKGGWKFKLRRGKGIGAWGAEEHARHNAGQKPRKRAISKQLRRGGIN